MNNLLCISFGHVDTTINFIAGPLFFMVYTSPTTKRIIVHLADEGKTYQQIGDQLKLHRSTASRIARKYRKSRDFYHVEPKSGRPPKLGPRDVRRAARHLANTTSHDVTDLQREHFSNVSTVTLWRHLKKAGIKAYVRRKRPYISPINRQKR